MTRDSFYLRAVKKKKTLAFESGKVKGETNIILA